MTIPSASARIGESSYKTLGDGPSPSPSQLVKITDFQNKACWQTAHILWQTLTFGLLLTDCADVGIRHQTTWLCLGKWHVAYFPTRGNVSLNQLSATKMESASTCVFTLSSITSAVGFRENMHTQVCSLLLTYCSGGQSSFLTDQIPAAFWLLSRQ